MEWRARPLLTHLLRSSCDGLRSQRRHLHLGWYEGFLLLDPDVWYQEPWAEMRTGVNISRNNVNGIQAYRFQFCCGICHEDQWWVEMLDDWTNVLISGLILEAAGPATKDSLESTKCWSSCCCNGCAAVPGLERDSDIPRTTIRMDCEPFGKKQTVLLVNLDATAQQDNTSSYSDRRLITSFE